MLFVEFHGSHAAGGRAGQALGESRANWARAVRLGDQGGGSARGCGRRGTRVIGGRSLRHGSQAMQPRVRPISRLAECVTENAEDIAANKLMAPIIGTWATAIFISRCWWTPAEW